MSSQNNRLNHPVTIHRGSKRAKLARNPWRRSDDIIPKKFKVITLEKSLRKKG